VIGCYAVADSPGDWVLCSGWLPPWNHICRHKQSNSIVWLPLSLEELSLPSKQ